MTPRPDVSDERKQQILDTAEEVFAKRGIYGARMDDIVAASGLSKGAIYWYFKKKDDIIAGLVDRIFRRSFDRIRPLVDDPRPASARLLDASLVVAHEYKQLSRLLPVAFEFYAAALRQRGVRKAIAGFYGEFRKALAPIIRQGIERGEFAPADPEDTAVALIALYEGLGLVWAIAPSMVDWTRSIDTATRMVINGLRVRQGGAS